MWSGSKLSSKLTVWRQTSVLRSISAPKTPKETHFTEMIDTLAQHMDPKPIIIAERYKVRKTEEEESETVRQ